MGVDSVPSGRHARDLAPLAEHASANAALGCDDSAPLESPVPAVGRLTRDTPGATPVQVTTATGRRPRPVLDTPIFAEPAAPAAPLTILDAPAIAEPLPTGGGRRRKPVEETLAAAPTSAAPTSAVPTTAEVAGGTGRRRRPGVAEAEALLVELSLVNPGTPVPATGTGRRRKVAEPIAPVLEAPVVRAPVVEAAAPAPLAEVVPISAASGRRAHPAARRKPRSLSAPGAPALVAGAAAIAVAAVGALNATDGGLQLGAGSADLARASALGLKDNSSPLDAGEARASRDLARKALAQRAKIAAAQKKKHDTLLAALKLAKERATRLAALAHLYRLPVSGYHLTAGFGEGGGLWSHGHTGQDFACPTGTPIHAVATGTIISAGWDGAYGWKTVERLDDGTEIWYAHQSAMLVRSGRVYAGEVIGRVGSTGNTTGPHLHLEVRPHGGNPINPMPWLRAHGMHP
jgi:murein DD-endopeptidase MepM/ murein hydrolase activator NlpD